MGTALQDHSHWSLRIDTASRDSETTGPKLKGKGENAPVRVKKRLHILWDSICCQTRGHGRYVSGFSPWARKTGSRFRPAKQLVQECQPESRLVYEGAVLPAFARSICNFHLVVLTSERVREGQQTLGI